MRRIPVLCGLVLVGGLLGPSTASASDAGHHGDEQHRWIAVEDQFAVVLPDGQTFTGDDESGSPEEELPPVGTRLFISEVLYTAKHDSGAAKHGTGRGDEVGRSHIECTTQVVQAYFMCDVAFVLDDGSQLHGSVAVDFSDESASLEFDIAVTGGTGDFDGATGVVHLKDISASPDETVTRYTTDIRDD